MSAFQKLLDEHLAETLHEGSLKYSGCADCCWFVDCEHEVCAVCPEFEER